MQALIDNDVLYKGAAYGLLPSLVTAQTGEGGTSGVLGTARFVVPRKIERANLRRGAEAALTCLREFLEVAKSLEPDEAEQRMAAELELAAQRLGLNFHVGESQLCAILVLRDVPLLLTGDKVAIGAMEQLLDAHDRLKSVCGRVRCLEQLVALLVGHAGANVSPIREAICGEPTVDKALANCFSCTSEKIAIESVLEGLSSYASAVQKSAIRIMS